MHLPSLVKKITHLQPITLAWILLVGLLFWVGQTLINVLIDSSISTEAVQAQQIRVKSVPLEEFKQTVNTYQAAGDPEALSVDRFAPAAGD